MIDPISLTIGSVALGISLLWLLRKILKYVRRSKCLIQSDGIDVAFTYSNKNIQDVQKQHHRHHNHKEKVENII